MEGMNTVCGLENGLEEPISALDSMSLMKNQNKLLCDATVVVNSLNHFLSTQCNVISGSIQLGVSYKFERNQTENYILHFLIKQLMPAVDYLATKVELLIKIYHQKHVYRKELVEIGETAIFTTLTNSKRVDIPIDKSMAKKRVYFEVYVKSAEYLDLEWELSRPKSYLPVGIFNAGATCYLNTLIQCLYFIPSFRKFVTSIDLQHICDAYQNEPPKHHLEIVKKVYNSTLFALQKVFYMLQHSRFPVELSDLTDSFHWNYHEIDQQHDVHELLLLLIEKVNTEWNEFIRPVNQEESSPFDRLLQGTFTTTLRSTDSSYKKTTTETFYSIPVDVLNCTSLEESLKKFLTEEVLSGSNQIAVESGDKQDGLRQTSFQHLPPVCFFQLKRFHYNPAYHTIRKMTTPFTFPKVLDCENCGLPSATPYYLQSVIIHEGNISSGHYYCVNCTKRRGVEPVQCCLFNDDYVSEIDLDQIMESSFGTKQPVCDLTTSSDSSDSSDLDEIEIISSQSDMSEECPPKRKPNSKSRLCLPGGKSQPPFSSQCAYILVYVNANQMQETTGWKNESWLSQAIHREFQLTVSDYFREKAQTVSLYHCSLLNQQQAKSLSDSKPVQFCSWNNSVFSFSFLTDWGVQMGIPVQSQEWYCMNAGMEIGPHVNKDHFTKKTEDLVAQQSWYKHLAFYCKCETSDSLPFFALVKKVEKQKVTWREVAFSDKETIQELKARLLGDLETELLVYVEFNPKEIVPLANFPPTALTQQAGFGNGIQFTLTKEPILPQTRDDEQAVDVFVFPVAKYSSLYEPFVLTLPATAQLQVLQKKVYKHLATTAGEKTILLGDYVYTRKQPRSVKDLRLFRYVCSSSQPERDDWEKNLDGIVTDRIRKEWIIETVSKQSGNGSTFDWQCGNEIDEKNATLIDLLPYRPSFLQCQKQELFCFFDIVENYNPKLYTVYYNSLLKQPHQEKTVQVESVQLKAILKASAGKTKSKAVIGYCVEDGRITQEHTLESLCNYAMKYQCHSQLWIGPNTYCKKTPLKIHSYVIEGWDEENAPIFSSRLVPRILHVSLQWTYQEVLTLLIQEYQLNQEDLLEFLYLDCLDPILSERSKWNVVTDFEMVLDDQDLTDGWEEDEGHPPIFALYINAKPTLRKSTLHIWNV